MYRREREVRTLQVSQTVRIALTQAVKRLHQRRWCDGTGGNFSVVVQKTPIMLLMAPSGVDKGCLKPEQLIVVGEDQQLIDGIGKPSAETALHIKIVDQTGAGAVLHTHSVPATVLSRYHLTSGSIPLQGWEMLKGLQGVNRHDAQIEVPVVANSQNMDELKERFHPQLVDAPYGILVAGHGLYAWGNDLQEAQRHLEILEFLLEVQLQTQRLGLPTP